MERSSRNFKPYSSNIENFRQYLVLRRENLQKTVFGCPWLLLVKSGKSRWTLKPHFLAVCFMHWSQASAKLPTMKLVYLSLEISITSINWCGNSIELCISHLLVINVTWCSAKTGRKRKHSMNLLISICEK